MLDVLYKNNQFLVCNKPAGVPVQSDQTGDPSFQEEVEKYCKHQVHLVNRIDRPVSGVVLFAKSAAAMTALTEQFRQRSIEKTYLAIVEGAPEAAEATLTHYLTHRGGKHKSSVSTTPDAQAEEAVLGYKILSRGERYTLLLVQPQTGRHHQIRAQLSAIGCPVKGDVKYGARRGNPDRSIDLHAWKLKFEHPVSAEVIEVEAPLPEGKLWAALWAQVQK